MGALASSRPAHGVVGSGGPRRWRDPRLDFFRGLALLFILINHAPGNPWARWTPARFGFSDAAEIFVFCSGIASALAFGALYARRGWLAGTVAIARRIWHVYWVHIGTFLVIAGTVFLLTASDALTRNYVSQLNLQHFFAAPGQNLVGLLTLRYVPNYFDILPMYLVILALVPIVALLAAQHRGLALGLVVLLWLGANLGTLALPAEPWSERPWFFNPFAWQFLFFLGFAFARGWLPAPPISPRLVWSAAAVVILAMPLANGPMRAVLPGAEALHEAVRPLLGKSALGPLRLLHFVSLAYLAWVLVGPRGVRLSHGTHWPSVVAVIRTTGQHSLPVFAAGLLISRLMGVGLDLLGRDWAAAALVNAAGIAVSIGLAYGLAWMKAVQAGASAEKTAVPAELAAEGQPIPVVVPGRSSSG